MKDIKTLELPKHYNTGQYMLSAYKALSSYCKEVKANYDTASKLMSTLENSYLKERSLNSPWDTELDVYKPLINKALLETKKEINKSHGLEQRLFE